MSTSDNSNNKHQQLIDAVRCLLEINNYSLTEYQLLQLLKEQGWELPINASDSVALFTTHFLLFNALYKLQDEYWASHRYLEISALKIQLHEAVNTDASNTSTSLLYSNDQSLREYYLDLTQLETATEESVNNLLNQFWGKFLAIDEKVEALEVLSLPATTNYQEIKKAYRRHAMLHHPDRGGDAAKFQAVNRAFGVLQRLYQ